MNAATLFIFGLPTLVFALFAGWVLTRPFNCSAGKKTKADELQRTEAEKHAVVKALQRLDSKRAELPVCDYAVLRDDLIEQAAALQLDLQALRNECGLA